MSLCLFFNPRRSPACSLCWWRLPSIQNFFLCNFSQKSKRPWLWAWILCIHPANCPSGTFFPFYTSALLWNNLHSDLCSPDLSFPQLCCTLLKYLGYPVSRPYGLLNKTKKKTKEETKKVRRKGNVLSCSSSFKGHVRRTNSVCGFLGIRSIRGRRRLDFETFLQNFFARQILKILTDRGRSRKVCEKTVWYIKSLHVQSIVVVRLDFWKACFALWSNVITTIPGSRIWWAENHYEYWGPVGPEACPKTAPGYAHGR